MSPLASLVVDLYRFVNSRYIFDETNYPIWKKLDKDEQKSFAITHSLLHLQKSIHSIIRSNHLSNDALKEPDARAAFTKSIVNLIKLSEIVGLTEEDLVSIEPTKQPVAQLNYQSTLIELMQKLATECERFDHKGNLNHELLRDIVISAWRTVVRIDSFLAKNGSFNLANACELAPTYMASK